MSAESRGGEAGSPSGAAGPFAITRETDIIDVLNALIVHRLVVQVRCGPGQVSVWPRRLDPIKRLLLCDVDPTETRLGSLERQQMVAATAWVDGVRVDFVTGPVEVSSSLHGRQFVMPWPETMQRIQRRAAYRVTLRGLPPMHCELAGPGDGTPTRLELIDLSALGLCTHLPPAPVVWVPGTLLNDVTLHLSASEYLTLHLEVRHVVTTGQPRAGFRFHQLNAAHAQRLARLVIELQRQVAAHRLQNR